MNTVTIQPLSAAKRTAIVDILRGWALLGVVMGNYADYADFGKPVKHAYSLASDILAYVNQYLFAAKSWTLLSVLFGYGFAVVMNNVAAKGKSPVAFFSGRMFWLFVIAFVNSAFWFGDILKDYAFLGLLLLPFYKSSAKTTFRTAVILLILMPFINAAVNALNTYNFGKAMESLLAISYSHNWFTIFYMNLKGTYVGEIILPQYLITVHVMMFACMLLGFAAQRIDFFNRLSQFSKQLKVTFWVALAIAVTFNLIGWFFYKWQGFFYFKPRYWTVFATMLFIATGICRLYINGKLTGFFKGLQAMGKMTLTNYMVQNILAVFIFLNVGLGLFNTQPYWFYIAIAVAIFVVQIFTSKWWLARYNYGPVEWIWRQLSYMKRLPIKKTEV